MLHEGKSSVLTHSANVAVNLRLTTVQTKGETQPVAPEKPSPPHWPYSATVPAAAEEVAGGETEEVGTTTELEPGAGELDAVEP